VKLREVCYSDFLLLSQKYCLL